MSPQRKPVVTHPEDSAGGSAPHLHVGMCARIHHLYGPHLEGIQANVIKQPNEKFAYAYSFHLTREIQAINIWRGI